jgi:hypothetical protein
VDESPVGHFADILTVPADVCCWVAAGLAGCLHALASTKNESKELCKQRAIDAQNEINGFSELADNLLRDLRKLVSKKPMKTISRALDGGRRSSATVRADRYARFSYARYATRTAPQAISITPSQFGSESRSPKKSTAKTDTKTTLSLSTGATRAASPSFKARK